MTEAQEHIERWDHLRATAWRIYTIARKQGDTEQRAVERVVEALHSGELCVHVEMDLAAARVKHLTDREIEGERPIDRDLVMRNDDGIRIRAQAAPLAEGPIDTYWIRRRNADPLHGQLTGCVCDACQNERGYYLRCDAGLTVARLAALLYELPKAQHSPQHSADPAMFYCATQATWLLPRLAQDSTQSHGPMVNTEERRKTITPK